jgi:hypothetical protein
MQNRADSGNAAKDSDILQHLPEVHLQHSWPDEIQNEGLWERMGQEPVGWADSVEEVGLIGHTFRKPAAHVKPWPGTRRARGREAGLQLAVRNWARDEETRHQLGRSSKISQKPIAQTRCEDPGWNRSYSSPCVS